MSSTPPAPAPSSPPPPPSNTTSPPPAPASSPPPPPTSPAPTPPPPTSPAPSSSPPPPAVPSSSPPPPASVSPPASPGSTSPPPPATPSVSSPPPPTRSSGGSTPTARSPPSALSPPPSSSSSSSISTGAVVGIAAGGVIVLLVVSLLCLLCCRKKRPRQQIVYYGSGPPMPPPKEDVYSGGPQNWQQHNAPPPMEHIMKIPPQPSPPPAYASRPPQSPVDGLAPPPPPPPASSSGGSASNYSGSENPLPPLSPGMSLGFSKSTFSYEELEMATGGFSKANLLGQGGFGYVHKGVLPNGKEVAVKSLKSGSGQGEREFQAEVEIISRVHHKHLVSLVGYCMAGGQRMLVYEFVPNGTLEYHLHGSRPTMEWATRLKIALGSAKGLAYLHEDCHPKIIHRDIKAANILLDYKYEAKVADFGLAKFTEENNTHISTRVMGTFGYLAPEYASSGKLTDKSDVFSFGVMLLELITGRRPVDTTHAFNDDSLVDWARPILTHTIEEGNYDELIDRRLEKNYKVNEVARMVACAAACVRHSARRRPRMSQIVRALEGDVSLDDLNEGIRPGHSNVYGSYGSSDYDAGQFMDQFRKTAFGSLNYPSTEYSAPTSEYGQIPSASSSEGQQTREMELGRMKKDTRGFSGSS